MENTKARNGFVAQLIVITLPTISLTGIWLFLYFATIIQKFTYLGTAGENSAWHSAEDPALALIRWAIFFIVIACVAAVTSIIMLSWKYIVLETRGLKQASTLIWRMAGAGAVISVIVLANGLLYLLGLIEPNIFLFFLMGTPLLLTYLHLRYLRGLQL